MFGRNSKVYDKCSKQAETIVLLVNIRLKSFSSLLFLIHSLILINDYYLILLLCKSIWILLNLFLL